MQIKTSVSGLKETAEALRKLPQKYRTIAGQSALIAGAHVIRKAAAENVKAITGASKDSTGVLAGGIRVYRMKKKRGMLRVGVMVQKNLVNKKKIVKGEPVRVGLYASVLEYGKAGQPPRSWLRKASENSSSAVFSVVKGVLTEKLAEAVEKAKR